MIKLIEIIIKVIATLCIGSISAIGLLLLALILWDGDFIDMAGDILDLIWKNKQ